MLAPGKRHPGVHLITRLRLIGRVLLLASTIAAHRGIASPPPLPGSPVPGEIALVDSVYSRSGSSLLWTNHGSPTRQSVEFVQVLRGVDTLGLRPEDYATDALGAALSEQNAGSSEADRTRFDRWLSTAAVRLVSHLHYGRIDPRTAGFELAEPRNDLDVAATVYALTSAPDVAGSVREVEPHFYHYSLLKSALARYRTLASDPALTQLPSLGRRALRAGDVYSGTPSLRRLLIAEGDLPGPADGADTIDAALIDALKRYQDRHGLTVDGVLSGATFAALTTPMTQRVRQIVLTLERWRWLPAFSSPPIIVNIPEFRLFAFETTADRVASILQMPVIVGEAYPSKRTPVFVGDLKYVVFRPYWDVPRSITLHEMLPKVRAHPQYLQKNHLEIVRGEGDDSPVLPPTPEAIAALAAGSVRLRQQPGEDNALGLIKFLFPNAHNVYMHSTPAHQLFKASRRAFSHGCIRVSDPTALAVYVLRGIPGWDAARVGEAMHAAAPSRVTLEQPIRVMILYGTAMATEAGPMQFFDDIYGHDRRLETLLGLKSIIADAGGSR